MNNTQVSEALVSTLLVFGVTPILLVINKSLPSKKECMAAVALTGAEMAFITSKLRLSQETRSTPLPTTRPYRESKDQVRIHKEKKKK